MVTQLNFQEIMKNSALLKIFHEFNENDDSNASVEEKKEKGRGVKDFRSTNLVASNYKILAKVLAEIHQEIIPSTISLNQNAFIKGRKIVNPVMVADEAMEDYKSSKKLRWLLKLELKKRFDCGLGFLIENLKEERF